MLLHHSIQDRYTKVNKNITSVGTRENQFLFQLADMGKTTFLISDAIPFWGSPHNTKIALHRLVLKGWLVSLEKGKYLIIPLEAGVARKWTEEPSVIAGVLVQPAAIAYWTALRHWNWTEQIPRITYVQTTSRKKTTKHSILGMRFEIVTVSKQKFYGHTKEWRNGKEILVTDREKTLLDCADDVERAGSIEELAKAVRAAALEISWARLNEYVRKFPIGSARKRLGLLFETIVPHLSAEARSVLNEWQRQLSAGIIPLQPSGSKSGKISTRWRVKINTTII